jgi:hypothetical protein
VAVQTGGFKSALDLDQDNKVIVFEVSGDDVLLAAPSPLLPLVVHGSP